MTKAIRIHETGGPEVLKYEDVEVGDPTSRKSSAWKPPAWSKPWARA